MDFLIFFEIQKNRESCSRTSRLQQKRASGRFRYPKIDDLSIDFSFIFMFFRNPLKEAKKLDFRTILASFLVHFASFFDTFSASIFGWFFGCHFF